ncbi:polysaccharide biosynthesis protein [Halobacillus sp. GSS1]|uniref:UDP-N-acetylglucosamine 4,6-dehydratase family protein n=1 Tax=Halobacillus sp. GSS1 TaxID=2815919 RepID=UPI001A8F38F6|nr:UDP-N-acetylglucosamine 4,6-dehydratase family protein [Halobacillus sp. GSS1]MBN9654812.1 polysaccharide biosynthesis protein [Halobacillus sp. GSS1]
MFFKDKKILVIGGTGTIGRSIVQTLLKDSPDVVRVFSRDEHKQHELQNQLGKRKDVRYFIGDVRDYDRVHTAMQGVDYVFHLAAMKHVPSCEYNPYEAVLTNIHGTNNVVRAALAQSVKKVVFTSTDKAISPTNAYGATKLTAERLFTSAEYSKGEGQTIFASVRFGNVMGSRGSVIPLFKNQILEHGKITVTDSSMTRFMMTLDQATKLTIQALQEAQGGEVFVLKMPIVLLRDLAELVIQETCRHHNLNPEDIVMEEIGLRPGEKMYEELMTHEESLTAWEMPDMYVIPYFLRKDVSYKNARKASTGTYSSSGLTPITSQDLYELLKNQRLI